MIERDKLRHKLQEINSLYFTPLVRMEATIDYILVLQLASWQEGFRAARTEEEENEQTQIVVPIP